MAHRTISQPNALHSFGFPCANGACRCCSALPWGPDASHPLRSFPMSWLAILLLGVGVLAYLLLPRLHTTDRGLIPHSPVANHYPGPLSSDRNQTSSPSSIAPRAHRPVQPPAPAPRPAPSPRPTSLQNVPQATLACHAQETRDTEAWARRVAKGYPLALHCKRSKAALLLRPDSVLSDAFGSHMVLQAGPDVCVTGYGAARGLSAFLTEARGSRAPSVCSRSRNRPPPHVSAGHDQGPRHPSDGGVVAEARFTNVSKCEWKACFGALTASPTRLTLTVCRRSAPLETLDDVMIGDVYLCAGQSNMDYSVEKELRKRPHMWVPSPLHQPYDLAADAPASRGNVTPGDQPTPLSYVTNRTLVRYHIVERELGKWFAAEHASMRMKRTGPFYWLPVHRFSSACYHFGHRLQRARPTTPIGLVQYSYGGARSTSFLPHNPAGGSGYQCRPYASRPLTAVGGSQVEREAARAIRHMVPVGAPGPGALAAGLQTIASQIRIRGLLWYQVNPCPIPQFE